MELAPAGRGLALDVANMPADETTDEEGLALRLAALGAPEDADGGAIARLREAVRRALDATVDGREPAGEDVATLNRTAAAAPAVPQLKSGELVYVAPAPPSDAFLAEIAADAIELIGGRRRRRVRRCAAPGCETLYVASRERQTWCSDRCGARARVARSRAVRRRAG